MLPTRKRKKLMKITVAGDITIDWNIAHRDTFNGRKERQWDPGNFTRASWQPGGAALLEALIRSVSADLAGTQNPSYQIQEMGLQDQDITPGNPRYHHSYSLWSEFGQEDRNVWRVARFLGLDPAKTRTGTRKDQPGQEIQTPDLVVLDDANLGFRDRPDTWPAVLSQHEHTPWIVMKMAKPVADGPLWDQVRSKFSEKLICILTADDLRLTEVQISRGLSWERTAQDLAWELVHNPRVNSLAQGAYTIVSFGPEGGLLLERKKVSRGDSSSFNFNSYLFFDPKHIEGTWSGGYPGGAIGYTICLTAGVIRQMMLSEGEPDIQQGIQDGIAAMRSLHKEGYIQKKDPRGKSNLLFPLARITRVLSENQKPLAQVEVQDPMRSLDSEDGEAPAQPETTSWTILHDRYQKNLAQVAKKIVLEGIETALPDVPFGVFGHLVTVDRQEIEYFRTICNLVEEYLKEERPKRPLSIGVFGAPGSGKSFGITQVANSLAPGKIQKLEFNLSQLHSPEELPGAFHQVRDVILKGKIPLVFWDEFDSSLDGKALGWLRYFLAPMQDSEFREKQLTHPIGRSIFVFAGGTSHTLEGFGQNASPEEAREAKVPDFVSRLKGYVNVMGPNRQSETGDPYYIIRRAILLRSILLRNKPGLFHNGQLHIDQGILRAFLHIGTYKHGIRSMETIITMSQLAGKTKFARSSLPSESQLNIHVNGKEFLARVQQINLSGELLERLARAHHKIFRRNMEAKGYMYGPKTDPEAKTHNALLPWEDLSEEKKEQNRSAVADIPHKLRKIGCVMVPARSNKLADFPEDRLDLELLAELEHNRWVHLKKEAGWSFAPETDPRQKQHRAILPWDDERLDEEEKDKDRELVSAIPEILKEIGYTVVNLKNEGP